MPKSCRHRNPQQRDSTGHRRDEADFAPGEDVRIVQFTPPGSAASIHFGSGITNTAPGSLERVVLVVDDIEAARDEITERLPGR
jgi:hypothetical protein